MVHMGICYGWPGLRELESHGSPFVRRLRIKQKLKIILGIFRGIRYTALDDIKSSNSMTDMYLYIYIFITTLVPFWFGTTH